MRMRGPNGEAVDVIRYRDKLGYERGSEVTAMPRSVESILRPADELAARFEDYEPDPAQELDASAVAALRSAVLERSEAERHLLEAVGQARRSGMPWSTIGTLVDTSGEAA